SARPSPLTYSSLLWRGAPGPARAQNPIRWGRAGAGQGDAGRATIGHAPHRAFRLRAQRGPLADGGRLLQPPRRPRPRPRRRRRRLDAVTLTRAAALSALLSGAAALVYEVLWVRPIVRPAAARKGWVAGLLRLGPPAGKRADMP